MIAPALKRKSRVVTRDFLLLQAELLDEGVVSPLVALLKVAKVAPSVSNHLEKAAT